MNKIIEDLIKKRDFYNLKSFLEKEYLKTSSSPADWKIYADTLVMLKEPSLDAYSEAYSRNLNNQDYDFEIDNCYAVELINNKKIHDGIKILENLIVNKNIKNARVYANLAWGYKCIGDIEKTKNYYYAAIEVNPNEAKYYCNLGVIFLEEAKFEAAMASLEKARSMNPSLVETYINLSNLYERIGDINRSIKASVDALKINPHLFEVHNNLGNALRKANNLFGSIQSFKNALKINPNSLEVMVNLADVIASTGEIDEAIKYCIDALSIDGKSSGAYLNLLFMANYHPALTNDQLFGYYQNYSNAFEPLEIVQNNSEYKNKKIRVGYVSPDFRAHSMLSFLYPVVLGHNTEEFEVFAFYENSVQDDATQKYKAKVAEMIFTIGMSDEQLCQEIQKRKIDILVDCAGHTNGNRLKVFIKKPAPISISAWGFGYTSGLRSIDYFLGSKNWLDYQDQKFFSEKIWFLPNANLAYLPNEKLIPNIKLPMEANGYVTFATLSRAIRINDRVIEVWANILKGVPNSKLRIDSGNFQSEKMKDFICNKFLNLGVSPERLIIGFTSPVSKIYEEVDIILDTFPHNSGTTLIDGLYCGIPFITMSERVSVGSIGMAMLRLAGLERLCASTVKEYMEIAINYSQDVKIAKEIRAHLVHEFPKSKYFGNSYVKDLEAAYKKMMSIKFPNDAIASDDL